MRPFTSPIWVAVSAIALISAVYQPVMAQSGTRIAPSNGSGSRVIVPNRSNSPARARTVLALEGYCPASLKMMNQWVKGKPSIQTVFDGHTYYFADERGKKVFLAEPGKYVPVLGGDCVVSLVKMGKRVPGRPEIEVIHQGMRYRFPSADQRNEFLANPKKHEVTLDAASPNGAGSRPPVGSGARQPVHSGSGTR